MSQFFTLFDLIGDLARRRYQVAEREFAVLGLNHTEARLLNLLQRAGGTAHQETLSQSMTIDRTNASRALKNLEQKGYLVRQQDSLDKRAKQVQMTAQGEQAVSEIAKLKHQMVESFFGELTESEAEMAVSLLSKALKPQAAQTSAVKGDRVIGAGPEKAEEVKKRSSHSSKRR